MVDEYTEKRMELLQSRLDELRAVVYSLSEKLSKAITRLDAGVSELSASTQEFKSFKAESHKQGIVSDVSEAVGNLFARHPKAEEVAVLFGKEVSKELDEKLAKLAALEAEVLRTSTQTYASSEESKKAVSEWSERFEKISDSIAELKSAVRESNERIEGVPTQVGREVDSKLSSLAELEAELLKKEAENAESLETLRKGISKFELSQNREEIMVNALGNLSVEFKALQKTIQEDVVQKQQIGFAKFDAVGLELKSTQNRLEEMTTALKMMASKQDENYASTRSALQRIIDNQNKVNEVLSEALSALLDSTQSLKDTVDEVKLHVTQMKSRVDLQLNPDEIERRVEEKLAKKLTGG